MSRRDNNGIISTLVLSSTVLIGSIFLSYEGWVNRSLPASPPTAEEKQPPLALLAGAVIATSSAPLAEKPGVAPLDIPLLPQHPARMKIGVQMGWEAANIDIFEKKTGIVVDMVAAHVHWGNEKQFPSYLAAAVRDRGKTLVLFWNPMDYNRPIDQQDAFSYENILGGQWDSYIASFAAVAKKYGGPVILIPFEEVNGNWTPWAGTGKGNSAEQHIAAYRYVHSFFQGAQNVSFGWAVNFDSVPNVPGNQLEDYYPGSAYVDYVGVNGFNFGDPWLSFDEVFSDAVGRLARYGKPLYIFSIASAQGERKAQWIRDFLSSPVLDAYDIKGWIWFNENKERDWRVWSDEAALDAFKKASTITS